MTQKIKVTLSNFGGELASETFEVPNSHQDPEEAINLGASAIIESWTLSTGDIIRIDEVEP